MIDILNPIEHSKNREEAKTFKLEPYVLGLKIEDGFLRVEPCISRNWKEYEVKYKYKTSIYNIKVRNNNAKNTGVTKFIVNDEEIKEKKILLQDNWKIYNL